MLRKKNLVTVPEGAIKEAVLTLISNDQKSPTVLTSRALWRYIRKNVTSEKSMHWRYHNRTEVLELAEGTAKDFWIKYTWNV